MIKHDSSESQPNTWQLVRQDDNGNQHIVATFSSENDAAQAMADYESRGHKQTFWVQESRIQESESRRRDEFTQK